MSISTPGTEEQLRKELSAAGAREFEIVALALNPDRGLAALHQAQAKGVNHPVQYAIALFDSPEWNPAGEVRRVVTNAHVERRCEKCDGHRFVSVTDDWRVLYGETYAPCSECNAECNTTFWRVDGTRVTSVAR